MIVTTYQYNIAEDRFPYCVRSFELSARVLDHSHQGATDDVAEWSKALDLGSSPKGRGFKPHRRHHY